MAEFDVPSGFATYMDSKACRQVGFLAQIGDKDHLHELLTEKVNAASEQPLLGDDLEFLKLKVEALWKASKTHFDTSLEKNGAEEKTSVRTLSKGEIGFLGEIRLQRV